MQVHRVRHDRRTQHGGGQQHALGALEPRQQARGHLACGGRLDEQACQESDRDDQQQPADHPLERALAAPVLDRQQQQRHQPRDHATDQKRQIEQQVQRDRATDDLGEIRCHGDQFGLQPVRDAGRGAGVVGDRLRQRAAGDEAELGRQELHQAGHRVGHDDDPDEQEAELRAGADVGGDVAGIDVGDGGDERRPEQEPAGPQPRLGVLDQLTHSLSGNANRKVRLAETVSKRLAAGGYQPQPQPPRPMTSPPPPHGQPPNQLFCWGEVTI